MNDDAVMKLCDVVCQTAFDLHTYLRHGHLEKVYENGLTHRLRLNNVDVEQQCNVLVRDEDDTLLGEYVVDLLVEKCLIVELKAARTLAPEHEAQLLGYLRACRIRHGMLINFGSTKLQIKKLVL